MGANSSDLRGLAADQVVTLIAEYFHSRNMSLSQAFAFLDRDNSQYITWEEFVRGITLCLENCGSHRVSNAELWPIFKRFDRNNDDKVSLDEFSAQFYPSSRGTSARTWYEDDMRMRGSGRMVGVGAPVMSPTLLNERRVDDVICRISSAIVRMGFTPAQLFEKVDLDHNGRLSWAELERVICSFQPDLSSTERQHVFQRFDQDGNQCVDINEFCGILNRCNATGLVSMEAKVKALGDKFRATGQTVADAFRVFDRNCDGFLTRDEWFRAMRTFDNIMPVMNDNDIDAVFRRFDVNGDGCMSIHEFDTFFRDAIDRSAGFYTSASYSPALGTGTSASYSPAPTSTIASPYSYDTTPAYGVLPQYVAPPVEEPWETEVLDTVRSCLAVGRSGMGITEVFRRLDIDHNNSMSPVEFQRVVCAYRPDLTAAHVDYLFRKVNTSNSGSINLSEFIRRFG
jgi:Ca2+-binding EF-hand superfamily protein